VESGELVPGCHVGCSGWHYAHWRGPYYPEKLPSKKWLQFYASQFNTVEINNSFYRLPSEKAVVSWRESSPDGFLFAVKVNQFITHRKKLRNLGSAMEDFLLRIDLLENKLGPLLYQLPPGLKRNDEVLEEFLSSLPRKYRHVFEFRHESWICDPIFQLLERYNASFCVFDMPGLSCPLVATADFAYIRLHGSRSLYSSCYSEEELCQWGRRVLQLGRKLKATYVYFNNDAEAFAVRNALFLMKFLGLHK